MVKGKWVWEGPESTTHKEQALIALNLVENIINDGCRVGTATELWGPISRLRGAIHANIPGDVEDGRMAMEARLERLTAKTLCQRCKVLMPDAKAEGVCEHCTRFLAKGGAW